MTNRCRLVLIAPPPETAANDEAHLEAALAAGDVASLIIPDYGQDEVSFQARAERLTPLAQSRNVAVMIAGAPRIAARVKADGIHFEGALEDLAEIIEKYQDRMMIGAGGVKTRDDALQYGELQPDYLFFGRFGYDNKPEPHPRNLALGAWWSEMVEIPCIVMAGNTVASVEPVAACGVDFTALSAAVFADEADPAAAVSEANAILDRTTQQAEGA
ncbi:MAG: thiamine phosphate synthase [Nitratireductor sp.]|jgi:thiamine-phosphate pyrophosphorylase|uniref:thiamine phosphate synthase n=1 Tax=Nitratireductor sp. B36 TaxID=2762059 RepID=UPI000C9215BB|nr:thiamine phosphate synthase [Nitratireductor sp. B36]MAS12223.1 thiamine phosphate synthase [Nitratireductor sp.]MCC5780400.1 thiamine phosphate synthase [Nitratireductor sp. B36]